MNWSLKIPSHLKRVATLPYKTLMFKNNVTDLYELPDFCPLNSPDLSTFISKYGAASLAEKAQDVDHFRQNLVDAWVGVEESVIDDGSDQWPDVSVPALEPQEDILNIHRDIN